LPESLLEQPDWPSFRWDGRALAGALGRARFAQGRLAGYMEAVSAPRRAAAALRTLSTDALKTSELAGIELDGDEVRSSSARCLGLPVADLVESGPRADGVVRALFDVAERHEAPLTVERLCGWHASLSGAAQEMRSGAEVARFLDWFEADAATEPVIKAALAHLWLLTIRPFEDGNGRLARAVTDLCLSRAEGASRRYVSVCAQLRLEQSDYHAALHRARHATMDATPWIEWWLGCVARAADTAYLSASGALARARVQARLRELPLTDRQRLVVAKLMEGGEGAITTSRWASLVHVSHDSALRDIQHLVGLGVLTRRAAGGRSTSYTLAMGRPADV
jgi:Fic family protein